MEQLKQFKLHLESIKSALWKKQTLTIEQLAIINNVENTLFRKDLLITDYLENGEFDYDKSYERLEKLIERLKEEIEEYE